MNYKNGKFIIEPFSDGILYGTGVFETILVKGKKGENLEGHYNRLINGCKVLDISYDMSIEVFNKHLNKFIERSSKETFALRVTVVKKGYTFDLMIGERTLTYISEHYQKGFKIKIGNLLKNPTSPLTYIKSICYADNLLSLKEARRGGYDEVLHLNFQGEICEGAISNVFFVKDGIVKTPHVRCGILEGTMRARVITQLEKLGILIEEGHYPLEELLDSDEVFLTNSLMGVMPVREVEGRVKTRKIYEVLKKN